MSHKIRIALSTCVVLSSLVLLAGCGESDSSSGTSDDATAPESEDTAAETTTFAVTLPNGGESWQQHSTYDITWGTGTIGGEVIIELRTGSGTTGSTALEIAAETNNDGSYSWEIPYTVATGSDYSIRIRSKIDSETVDWSDKAFAIAEASSLTLTSAGFQDGKAMD